MRECCVFHLKYRYAKIWNKRNNVMRELNCKYKSANYRHNGAMKRSFNDAIWWNEHFQWFSFQDFHWVMKMWKSWRSYRRHILPHQTHIPTVNGLYLECKVPSTNRPKNEMERWRRNKIKNKHLILVCIQNACIAWQTVWPYVG